MEIESGEGGGVLLFSSLIPHKTPGNPTVGVLARFVHCGLGQAAWASRLLWPLIWQDSQCGRRHSFYSWPASWCNAKGYFYITLFLRSYSAVKTNLTGGSSMNILRFCSRARKKHCALFFSKRIHFQVRSSWFK